MAFILRNVGVAEISSADVYKFNMGIHFLQLCKKVFKHLNPSKFYCPVFHNIKSFFGLYVAEILPPPFLAVLHFDSVLTHQNFLVS